MEAILGRCDEHGHSRFKRAQQGNTISREALTSPERLTGPQARGLRGHYARLAELFATRGPRRPLPEATVWPLSAVNASTDRAAGAVGPSVRSFTPARRSQMAHRASSQLLTVVELPGLLSLTPRVVGLLLQNVIGPGKVARKTGVLSDTPQSIALLQRVRAPAAAIMSSQQGVNTNETLEWRHNRCPRIRAGR